MIEWPITLTLMDRVKVVVFLVEEDASAAVIADNASPSSLNEKILLFAAAMVMLYTEN